MRIVRDFLVGVLSSTAVVILDRLHFFDALFGSSPSKWFHTTSPWQPSAIMAAGAFLVGILGSRFLAASSRIVGAGDVPQSPVAIRTNGVGDIHEFHDTLPTEGTGRYEIFYPVTFSKTPTLKIAGTGDPEYQLIEQRPDGFVISIRSVRARSIFGSGYRLSWSARGQVRQVSR